MKNKKKILNWLCFTALPIACGFLIVCLDYVIFHILSQHKLIASFIVVLVGAALIGCYAVILIALSQLEGADSKPIQEIAITANHGGRLETAMEAIRNEKYEYMAYFNLAGHKLAEGTYLSPDHCNITTEDWQKVRSSGEEIIKLHNHPNTNTAFSAGDFAAFLSHDFFRQTIVVTKGYNYILEKTGNGYEHLQDEVEAYINKMDIRYGWIYPFSIRLWSVVSARKTAKWCGLNFSAKRIKAPVKRRALYFGIAVCAIAAVTLLIQNKIQPPISRPLNTFVTKQCSPMDDPYFQGNALIAGGTQDQLSHVQTY